MSTTTLKKTATIAFSILSSKKFFYGIVGLLVLQAIWTALTARYPMAFDENFHWGIIKIYSHQWGPFITSTPPDSGAYGELVRTPSYLYHYLMSFPYRLIASITNQETVQIIFLRFINIGLFATGLFVFRKVLLRLRFSAAVAHLSLLLLILVPVVPFLAGQINYDNLLFILTPAIALAALQCRQEILQKGRLPAPAFVSFLALGMLGSLVKYAFLPIFLAAILYVAVVVVRQKNIGILVKKTWSAFATSKPLLKVAMLVLLAVSFGLFAERYGGNIIHYQSLDPDCAKVESIDHCKEYGPWARNYLLTTGAIPSGTDPTPFAIGWVIGIVHRLYFAINYDYINYYELPLPVAAAYAFGLVGAGLTIIYWRRLLKANPRLLLIALITVIYVASLVYVNYSDYLKYDAFLAINGRYLIPILPFIFAVMAAAYGMVVRKKAFAKRGVQIKFGLVALLLLFTLQGGGILTYAVRSDPNWYWQNPLAKTLGQGLKDIASPFIIGSGSKVKG
jgi:hypothetical protein